MHHDEKWQVYQPNGEPILGVGWDSALGNPEKTGAKAIVGVAVVFVYRVNDEDVLELLWQKRSDSVDRFPGKYDISAGGHINLGESIVDGAIRECREEIGIEIGASDLKFVTERGFNKNRFAWVFAVDWTGKSDDFTFNDREVSEIRWVPFEEIDDFRTKYAKEPLRNDKLTFALLREWFLQNGYL